MLDKTETEFQLLLDALGDLKTARTQFLPSDDAIIRERIESAISILDEMANRHREKKPEDIPAIMAWVAAGADPNADIS